MIGKKVFRFCSSVGLAVIVLCLLLLITWLGTEAQPSMGLFQAQEKYFNSLIVFHKFDLFSVTLPIPGAKLLLGVFAINLICGGLIMLRKSKRTVGVMIAHFSMLFLLAGGLLQHQYAEDGYMQLYEGEESNEFVSYHNWVIRVHEVIDGQPDFSKEALVLPPDLVASVGEQERTVDLPGVPFDLRLYNHSENATVMPEAFWREGEFPVVEGTFVRSLPQDTKNEANVAATYIDVLDASGQAKQSGILWGQEMQPLTIQVGERSWVIKLDRQRWPIPFTVKLDKFTAEFFDNGTAKTYESEVTKIDGDSKEERLIEMNEPLRDHGFIVFQSGYGPQDERGRVIKGETPYSVFAVWKNPTSKFFIVPVEHWPAVTVSLAALGMAIHFLLKLTRHLDRSSRAEPVKPAEA